MKSLQLYDMPNVNIILLNYHGAEDTIACLESLNCITYMNYYVIIIDNASIDNSVNFLSQFLHKYKPDDFYYYGSVDAAMSDERSQLKYTLIQSSVNGGYGAGNNIGINYALKNEDTDYVLIINNDTIVSPGFLEPMVEVCEEDKNIGIASGKIYHHDRPDIIWFNGGKFHSCTSKIEHINFGEKESGQNTPVKNTFITGCLWLLPRKTIQKVGLINEEYFMYVEDLEYCQRILKHGLILHVSESCKIYHKVGSSTGGRFSKFSVYWRVRNMNIFISDKNSASFCKVASLFIFNLKTFVNLLLSREFSLIKTQLRAIKDAFNGS